MWGKNTCSNAEFFLILRSVELPRSGLRISKRFILRSLDLSYDCEEEGDRPYVVSMQYKVFYTLSRSYPSSAERLSNGVRDAEAQQRQLLGRGRQSVCPLRRKPDGTSQLLHHHEHLRPQF